LNKNYKYGCLYIEVIMGAVVAVVKPVLLQIATHPAVKNLVISLLEKYVKSTDNSIDDQILTKRTEANGILDFVQLFLRTVLNKGPKN